MSEPRYGSLEGEFLEQVEWMARVWSPRQLADAIRLLSERAERVRRHETDDEKRPEPETWQSIETFQDDGLVVVFNGHQSYVGYYQDGDGWFGEVDGELLRIDPPPTHWIRRPQNTSTEGDETT